MCEHWLACWPWPLTIELETGAHYYPWGGQPSYQFWCFYGIVILDYRPTTVRRITWPCDLDLWPCRQCGSSCCVCVPSLKFLGLGRYCAFTVWALICLVTLTFDLSSRVTRVMDLHPANFGLPRPFRSLIRSTDRHTSPSFCNAPSLRERGHNNRIHSCSDGAGQWSWAPDPQHWPTHLWDSCQSGEFCVGEMG